MALSTRLASPLRPMLAALRGAAPGQCRELSTPQGPGHTLDLGGIFPPLTTPFSPMQEVDYARLEGNLHRYASIPFRGKRCPSLCRLLWQGLCGSMQAACWLPEGAQPPHGLCSGAGSPSGTHLGPFAWHMSRHTHVSLHTTTHQCVFACMLHM